MIFNFTLLSSLLLASAALAAPSSLVEAPLARGREDRQSRSINRTVLLADAPPPCQWLEKSAVVAGATWVKPPGTFTRVTAKFNVPEIRLYPGNVSIWVGIDRTPFKHLWIGVTMTLGGPPHRREVNYTAWYERSAQRRTEIPSSKFKFEAGHFITATVHAYSSTEAEVSLYNHNNGNKVDRLLCGLELSQVDAVWFVDSPMKVGGPLEHGVYIPHFTEITFTNAFASDKGYDDYFPFDATLFFNLWRMEIVRMKLSGEREKKDTLTIWRTN